MSWILSAILCLGLAEIQDPPKPAPPAGTPQAAPAPAPAPAPGQSGDPKSGQPAPDAGGMGGVLQLVFPLAICGFIIYFMMIRPQKKQMKERESMLDAIRKNDEIVTSSGIIGTVLRIKDQEVVLVVDSKRDVQLRVLKSAIMTIRKKSGEEEENDKPAEDAKDSKKPEETNKGVDGDR